MGGLLSNHLEKKNCTYKHTKKITHRNTNPMKFWSVQQRGTDMYRPLSNRKLDSHSIKIWDGSIVLFDEKIKLQPVEAAMKRNDYFTLLKDIIKNYPIKKSK